MEKIVKRPPKQQIDFTIDGIGEGGTYASAPAPAAKGKGGKSKIDIPLDGVTRKVKNNADLTDTEFEFVNRHHEQVKAEHRRARQGGKK